jgi:hypothetical protein
MKTFTIHTFLLFFLVGNLKAQFQFISPLPGSRYHNTDRTIIIREGSLIKPSSLAKENLFSIKGNKSGIHQFKTILSPDGKTIILNL